jgi:5-bromo-4-chloroindolyl phosphate hydrolysis protein
MLISEALYLKIVLLIGFLLNNFAFINSTTVYICDSRNTKKYHYKSSCRGLSNCQYRTIKTTLEKAKSSGKTLCGWED